MVGPGSDAAVVRIKGTKKALALKTDGNGRYCWLDPFEGARLAVAEACRNVVAAGATPLGATNCLNFGNPERPEVMGQLVRAIAGIREACIALDVPITGGNVSLYNETEGRAIYPTPILGVVGLLEDADRVLTSWFKEEGDVVYLLGDTQADLGGSELLQVVHGIAAGRPPRLDLAEEKRLHALVLEAAAAGWLRSAHDCSDGGLAVALAECAFRGEEPGPRRPVRPARHPPPRRPALLRVPVPHDRHHPRGGAPPRRRASPRRSLPPPGRRRRRPALPPLREPRVREPPRDPSPRNLDEPGAPARRAPIWANIPPMRAEGRDR